MQLDETGFDEINQGHFTRREEVKKIFNTVKTKIPIEEIFNKGRKVGVIGQAGIGKSMMSLMVASKAVESSFRPPASFIFFIPLRYLNYDRECSLLHFLTAANDIELTTVEGVLTKREKKLLKLMTEKSMDILLILDGLDEVAIEDFSVKSQRIRYDSIAKADVFLKNILNGTLFPQARVLITSRPKQLLGLHADDKPRIIYTLKGLSEASQELLCRTICPDKFDIVWQVLQENQDLKNICYVPINAHMIFACLYSLLQQSRHVTNLTGVMVYAFIQYIRSQFVRDDEHEVNSIRQISEIALRGIEERKFTFTTNDFETVNDFQAFLHYVMITKNTQYRLLEGEKVFCFSHLSYQEFLASQNIAYFLSDEKFALLFKTILEAKWEVVLRFLFGFISNKEIENCLSLQMSPKKKIMLRGLVVDQAKDPNNLLAVCGWVKEAASQKIAIATIKHFPRRIILPEGFLPFDASNLVYLLKHDDGDLEFLIEINSFTDFIGESFQILCFAISRLKLVSILK